MAKKSRKSASQGTETRHRNTLREKVPAAAGSEAFAVASSAELYKLAKELRAILDAIITIDHRGIIVRINAAAATLFGYSENEMLRENVSLLMP